MTDALLSLNNDQQLDKAAKPQQLQWGCSVITRGILQLYEASPKCPHVGLYE